MTDKRILSFSIGPVQGFISQARKTKDSFSGSKMLSDIIDNVLSNFDKEQIVFPDIEIESKPNRFIMILEKDMDYKEINKKIENLARAKFIDISNTTYDEILGGNNKPIGFKEQIEDFLDVNWVTIDYDKNNYKKVYNELDVMMGAVKNTRQYQQIKVSSEIGEVGKKCTICGERNALFYKKRPRRLSASKYNLMKDNYLSEKESLCAVCFVKRYYEIGKEGKFPSTAEISLMNVLNRKKANGKNVFNINEYKNNDKFTADLLYEENVNIEYIKENGMLSKNLTNSEEQSLVRKLMKIRKKREEEANKRGLKFSRYYSIISFDGDSMGEWLSGDKIDGERITLLDFHRKLSKCLGDFSKKAKEKVNKAKEPKGKIIYAGGEDFLAFINNEYIFDVMVELRELFDIVVNRPLKQFYKNERENITFSAGICISHYKTTLSNSILWAKKMEEKSKEIEGKNAFSIALLKRSGELVISSYRWKESNEDSYIIIEDINNIINGIKKGYFSNSFVYKIGQVIHSLPDKYSKRDIQEGKKDNVDKIIKSEIKRLLFRSANLMALKDKYQAKVDKMLSSLVAIYEKSNRQIDFNYGKDNYMNLLYILVFLEKEVYYANRD